MARQRNIPDAVRPIPRKGNAVRGGGEDAGRYFRCGYCGFICSVDRDELGGPEDQASITPTAYTLLDQYGNTTGYCSGKAAATQAACTAAGGTWVTTRYQPVVNAFCPLCGSPNNG